MEKRRQNWKNLKRCWLRVTSWGFCFSIFRFTFHFAARKVHKVSIPRVHSFTAWVEAELEDGFFRLGSFYVELPLNETNWINLPRGPGVAVAAILSDCQWFEVVRCVCVCVCINLWIMFFKNWNRLSLEEMFLFFVNWISIETMQLKVDCFGVFWYWSSLHWLFKLLFVLLLYIWVGQLSYIILNF